MTISGPAPSVYENVPLQGNLLKYAKSPGLLGSPHQIPSVGSSTTSRSRSRAWRHPVFQEAHRFDAFMKLGAIVKEAIEENLDDIKSGRVSSHQAVMKEINAKHNS